MKNESAKLRIFLHAIARKAIPMASVSAIRLVVGRLLDSKGDKTTISEAVDHLKATKNLAEKCSETIKTLDGTVDYKSIRIATTSIISGSEDKLAKEALDFFFNVADMRYGKCVNKKDTLESLERLANHIMVAIEDIEKTEARLANSDSK